MREGYASEQEALEAFVVGGARQRFRTAFPTRCRSADPLRTRDLWRSCNYAAYFLTVHDIARFARARTFLCQGRGSAANSAVCFCLGITEVDPTKHDLLFERFISAERREPPDIDVDFEHERREEVIQYIYQRYGRTAPGSQRRLITYRATFRYSRGGQGLRLYRGASRGAVNEPCGVASRARMRRNASAGLDPTSRASPMLELAQEIAGFPRHLSQHVGGFVITRDAARRGRADRQCGDGRRTIVEWDKDDLDALGILKIDILALGMLSCLRRAFDLLGRHYGRAHLWRPSRRGAAVYDMISRADTIGVFQIESRAQMSMLPRLKPNNFYDLVIEVAIVRPGPIQGDMVHPYLRRRQGIEAVSYPSKELRRCSARRSACRFSRSRR